MWLFCLYSAVAPAQDLYCVLWGAGGHHKGTSHFQAMWVCLRGVQYLSVFQCK